MRATRLFRILAVVLVLTGLGISAFWINWFASGLHKSALPLCYRLFENTFPYPDLVMAALMFASAYGLWRCAPWSLATTLGAGGMCLHLAALDTWYHWTHGNFADPGDPEFASRVFICGFTTLLGGTIALILPHFDAALQTRLQLGEDLIRHEIPRVRKEVRNVALLVGFYGGVLAALAVLRWLQPDPDAPLCRREFFSAFFAADVLAGLSALVAACLIWSNPVRGYRAFWVIAGLALFRAIIVAAFLVQNPSLAEGTFLPHLAGHAAIILAVLSGAVVLWRRRIALGA